MILKYKNFIQEKMEVSQTDSPGLTSKKNFLNDLEKHIKEYSAKKNQLERIYTNYTDDKNLLQLLKSNGFVDKTIDNSRKIEFLNPIFTIYYRACEKMRQLNALSKSIDELNLNISEKEKTMQSDATQSNLKIEIEQLKDQLRQKVRQLDTYKSDIKDIESKTKSELNDMMSDLKEATKDTRTAIQEK